MDGHIGTSNDLSKSLTRLLICGNFVQTTNMKIIVMGAGIIGVSTAWHLVQRGHDGINYHRLERGIAHYFTDQKSLDSAAHAASLMQGFGVKRTVISRSELLEIEPALRSFAAMPTPSLPPAARTRRPCCEPQALTCLFIPARVTAQHFAH